MFYRIRIMVMPTISLAFTNLYNILNNAGGMRDMFAFTLKGTLETVVFDGASIDFEMLVTPSNISRVKMEDWIVTWERVSIGAFRLNKNDLIFSSYWLCPQFLSKYYTNKKPVLRVTRGSGLN